MSTEPFVGTLDRLRESAPLGALRSAPPDADLALLVLLALVLAGTTGEPAGAAGHDDAGAVPLAPAPEPTPALATAPAAAPPPPIAGGGGTAPDGAPAYPAQDIPVVPTIGRYGCPVLPGTSSNWVAADAGSGRVRVIR